MARDCRISRRYMADALTVCSTLRVLKRVHDSNRKAFRYVLNPGGMTLPAGRGSRWPSPRA